MPAPRLPILIAAGLSFASIPAAAQELPDKGQSEAAFQRFVAAKPHFAAEVRAFEAWLRAKRIAGILPTWQILRTASMWSVCNGPPFEVPPLKLWRNVGATLRFVRDHVVPALGPVQAVSGYRNKALNACAGGAARSAHRDYSALDLVPVEPLGRRQILYRLCEVHGRKGRAAGVGLGFYASSRFHVDTRSFRRWGSAGPAGNESPCAVIERGGNPEAPPLPRPAPQRLPIPEVPPGFSASSQEVPSIRRPKPQTAPKRWPNALK